MASSHRNGLSSLNATADPMVGSQERLDKIKRKLLDCRSEREREEEIRRLEDERLQEIISFCQQYNESFKLSNKPATFSDALAYAQEPLNGFGSRAPPSTPATGRPPIPRRTSSVPKAHVERNNNTTTASPLDGRTLLIVNGKQSAVENGSDVVEPLSPIVNGNGSADTSLLIVDGNQYDARSGDSLASLDQTDEGDEESETSTLRNTESRASSETLNALMMEKALLVAELEQIQQQPMSDTEDDELREFQKIEREIKLAEVNKCLLNVEDQIANRSSASSKPPPSSSKPPTADGQLPEQSKSTSNLTNGSHASDRDPRYRFQAPLAEAETSDDESVGETLDGDGPEEYSNNTYDILMYSTPNNKKKSSSLPPNELHSVKRPGGGRGSLQHQRSMPFFVPNGQSPGGHDKDGLTKYLVSLGHELHSYTDLVQMTCCTCSGYLWKLCSKTENKWKKRYFHFDRHYRIFFYYKSLRQFKKVKKPNGGVYFDDIRDVYIDRGRTKRQYDPESDSKSATLKRKNDGRCVFVVETTKRQYTLSTFVYPVMRIWIDSIFTAAESYFD